MSDFEKVTYHRDGTVSFWNVFSQTWERTGNPTDQDLATMDHDVRERVLRHVGSESQ